VTNRIYLAILDAVNNCLVGWIRGILEVKGHSADRAIVCPKVNSGNVKLSGRLRFRGESAVEIWSVR
jgi:hypothetical protein